MLFLNYEKRQRQVLVLGYWKINSEKPRLLLYGAKKFGPAAS